jgi:hypothetical protein
MLPPAIQEFGISASAFLAGIDEMLDWTNELAASLDAVVASAERMGESLAAAADGADAGLAAASDAAKALADAESAALDRTAGLAEGLSGLGDAETALADAGRVAADAQLSLLDILEEEEEAARTGAGIQGELFDAIDLTAQSARAAAVALAAEADAQAAATESAQAAAAAEELLADAAKSAADAAAFERDFLADLSAGYTALADSQRAVIASSADVSATLARTDAILEESAAAVTTASVEQDAALRQQALAADEAAAADTRAGEAAKGMGASMKTALLGVALAVGFGVEQAAKFQSVMLTLVTQAGVSKSALAGLSQGVLDLAGKVGFTPTSLATALYHIESSFASVGISGKKALSLLQIAAEGAAVGHADLTDVTNALDATIVAGVPGISSYSQAMGALNAIVGSGDMTMQDLANAMGTGVMAVAKSYGQSIYQVGAALALFGDNNIRGAKAATELRMAWQAMQAPLTTAGAALDSIGLKSTTLASTMEHHGMSAAIDEFIEHLKASHVPMSDWGQLETEIFGKKAGVGIGIMVDQYGRLMSKFPDLERGAKGFGSAWANTQKTFDQQWHDFLSGLDALAISFGTKLMPAVTAVVGGLAKFAVFLEHHGEIAAFAGAMLAVAAGFKAAATMEALFDIASDADPVMLILEAVVALAAGLYELYEHSKLVRDAIDDVRKSFLGMMAIGLVVAPMIAVSVALYELYRHSQLVRDDVADVGKFFAGAWEQALHGAEQAISWFVNSPLALIKQEIGVFTKWWAQNSQQIDEIAGQAWGDVKTIITFSWGIISTLIRVGLAALGALWKTSWTIFADTVKYLWGIIATTVRVSIQLVLDAITVVLDILTGRWGAAWHALVKLADDALHGTVAVIMAYVAGFGTLLWDAGKAIVQGLIGGIESMAGAAWHEVAHLGDDIKGAFMGAIHAMSPSKDFYQFGVWIVQGLSDGISQTAAQATAKAAQLAAEVKAAYLKGQLTSAQESELLGDISTDLADRGTKLVTEMQKIGLAMGAGLMSSLVNAATRSQAKTAVDKLITDVEEAWSVGDISFTKASSLTSWLESDNDKLQNLAAERQKLAATIKTADTYANTTTTNTESWAGLSNITSSMTSGGMVYSGNILAGMKTDLSSISQFSAALKKLGHLGLSKNLLNQIIQMGPASGLQVAQALIDGPLSVIRSMNATQSAINSYSSGLGQTAANLLYDSGAQAGKGFLSGLQAQQKNITAMMDKIAKSMVEVIEKDLKIHSPSLVTTEHGEMIAMGLVDGLEHGIPWARGAAHQLSLAATPGGYGGAPGFGQGGGNTTITIQVHVDGFVGSNQELATEIYNVVQKEALRHNRRNGNNGFSLDF